MGQRRRRQKPRHGRLSTAQPRPLATKYPIATIAYYGPDNKHVAKITVGVIEAEGSEPVTERWLGPDVATNPKVMKQIAGFIEAHGAAQVVMTDGILGCPHEEGIDFPEGQDCPYCPFWRGKQGIVIKSPIE